MKKIKILFALVCIALMATIIPLASHAAEVDIHVAPNVINIDSNSPWVTVHADILFAEVDLSTNTIKLTVEEGILPNALCFADDRGYLVAKFEMGSVKSIFELIFKGEPFDDDFPFLLSGETNSGDNFSGELYISVFFDKSELSGGKM